jgi:hypothetical protein
MSMSDKKKPVGTYTAADSATTKHIEQALQKQLTMRHVERAIAQQQSGGKTVPSSEQPKPSNDK